VFFLCTGNIPKFYCKLKNDEDQGEAAKELEDAAMSFCVHATAITPLTMPVKLESAADTLTHADQNEVGFVSASLSAPPTQQLVRGQPSKPTKPVAWPSHVFYAYDKESGRWKAAVHADVWYTKRHANGNWFVPQRKCKNRKLLL
jgi:hypothetical protein